MAAAAPVRPTAHRAGRFEPLWASLRATLAAWHFILSRPSPAAFAHLAAYPGASLSYAYVWVTAGAGLAWALPAAAGVLRGGVPGWALVVAYWGLVALTVGVFAASTGAAHWLAGRCGARGEYARLAFAWAAFAAPLTLLAGLLLAGPAPLRLALLPLAGYGLALTVLAVRGVYQLEWRWVLVAALPAAALLAGLPLAAVAGVWAGLA
jgi:hypothetical protein